MKPIFILFVVVHLLTDLALPSLPGAFRFNPDESVAGIRVQQRAAQDLRAAPQPERLREGALLPRVEKQIPVHPRWNAAPPDLLVLLPRRTPSSDGSPQQLSEDA